MTERSSQQVHDRELSLLLLPSLEENVSADNPVHAIDLWVRSLDLQQLGFKPVAPAFGRGFSAVYSNCRSSTVG